MKKMIANDDIPEIDTHFSGLPPPIKIHPNIFLVNKGKITKKQIEIQPKIMKGNLQEQPIPQNQIPHNSMYNEGNKCEFNPGKSEDHPIEENKAKSIGQSSQFPEAELSVRQKSTFLDNIISLKRDYSKIKEIVTEIKINYPLPSFAAQAVSLPLVIRKPKILILEVQWVLAYLSAIKTISFDEILPVYRNEQLLSDFYVSYRPYLAEFLHFISNNFEIIIFSELLKDILKPMIEGLNQDLGINITNVIGREFGSFTNKSYCIKELNLINKELEAQDYLIIDNSEINTYFHKEKTLILPRFKDQESDKCLLLLMKILEDVIKMEGKMANNITKIYS